MRLATWNCHSSLAAKWGTIEGLNADVLTVQECGPRTCEQVASHGGWSCEWQKGTNRNGLAVLARAPYEIATREEPSAPFFVSTVIAGPNQFRCRFVGVWTRTPTSIEDGYPAQATHLIEQLSRDEIPTVIAGDFNASSRNAFHLGNVESLRVRGLVSAYHKFHGIEHDETWEHATSYHRWQQSKPHHMDYLFVPEMWPIQNVEVGTFEDYSRTSGLSDHVPVVVSLNPE